MGRDSAGRQKVLINWTNGDANEVSDYPRAGICQRGSAAQSTCSPDVDIPTVAPQTYIPPSNLHKSIPCAISSTGITPVASTSSAHLQPAGPPACPTLIQVSRPQPTSLDKPAHISLRFKVSGPIYLVRLWGFRVGLAARQLGRSGPLAHTQQKNK